MEKYAIVIFKNLRTGEQKDLKIPVDITANELYSALNSVFGVNGNEKNMLSGYLKSENPINFLKGEKTLREYGIRNGTVIMYS